MNANLFLRLGLLAVSAIAISGCSADAGDDSSAAGSAVAKKKGAKDEGGVTITVSGKDSDAAQMFYYDFIQDFTGYAKHETDERNYGASTWDEIDKGIYKMEGNDGLITCTFPKPQACTFSFKDPVDPKLGVPVLRGEGSSSLANKLEGYFRPKGAYVAGVGGGAGGEASDAFAIGEKADGIYIECQSDGTERGLPVSKCTFYLTGKQK